MVLWRSSGFGGRGSSRAACRQEFDPFVLGSELVQQPGVLGRRENGLELVARLDPVGPAEIVGDGVARMIEVGGHLNGQLSSGTQKIPDATEQGAITHLSIQVADRCVAPAYCSSAERFATLVAVVAGGVSR